MKLKYIDTFKNLQQQTKTFFKFIIYSVKKKQPTIDYFLFATSIGVLFLLFIPTSFWLIVANIYLIFLNGFYNHISRSNKFIQVTIVLWLLSLLLYALTVFITFDETFVNIIVFAIRRFVFLLIFIITLIFGQDLPAVQNFQADYATFNEGPSNKSAFFTFIRKHHILIIFSCFFSYTLATSVFLTNPLISTFFGILTLGFAALYLVQAIVYLIAFWKKPLDKSSSISSKNSSKKKRSSGSN
jgi:hypothetical protein